MLQPLLVYISTDLLLKNMQDQDLTFEKNGNDECGAKYKERDFPFWDCTTPCRKYVPIWKGWPCSIEKFEF